MFFKKNFFLLIIFLNCILLTASCDKDQSYDKAKAKLAYFEEDDLLADSNLKDNPIVIDYPTPNSQFLGLQNYDNQTIANYLKNYHYKSKSSTAQTTSSLSSPLSPVESITEFKYRQRIIYDLLLRILKDIKKQKTMDECESSYALGYRPNGDLSESHLFYLYMYHDETIESINNSTADFINVIKIDQSINLKDYISVNDLKEYQYNHLEYKLKLLTHEDIYAYVVRNHTNISTRHVLNSFRNIEYCGYQFNVMEYNGTSVDDNTNCYKYIGNKYIFNVFNLMTRKMFEVLNKSSL